MSQFNLFSNLSIHWSLESAALLRTEPEEIYLVKHKQVVLSFLGNLEMQNLSLGACKYSLCIILMDFDSFLLAIKMSQNQVQYMSDTYFDSLHKLTFLQRTVKKFI